MNDSPTPPHKYMIQYINNEESLRLISLVVLFGLFFYW